MPASRPFAAGPASSEDAKGANGAAGGDSGGQAAAAAPEEETDDDESEAARAAMSEAFENLIGAAFEMVQQGKPMEAEYVLSEGEPPTEPPTAPPTPRHADTLTGFLAQRSIRWSL